MTRHFIEHIRIKNFKCFEDLQIKGLARVNLFGGKNNVGKSALLESIELLTTSPKPHHLIYKLAKVLERRYTEATLDLEAILNLFNKTDEVIYIDSIVSNLSIKLSSELNINHQGSSNIYLSVNDKRSAFGMETVLKGKFPILVEERVNLGAISSSYIKPSKLEENEIAVLYGGLVEADKESYLNESLNKFDSSLLSFKAIPTDRKARAKLKVAGRDSLVSLSEMGDGISRYIAILCAIWSAQNGFLFIDEIENGIHYTNYPKLWNLIFDASEQANCQVFATSHSKECIEAFNQVQQAREAFKDAGCYFELFKSMKTGRITAAARGSEQLQYALEHGEEIRGE